MGDLWRRVSELIWLHPVLWVPVLVADLLGFFVNLGREAAVRSIALSSLQYKSVLGGATRAPISARTMEHATNLVIAVSWGTYFVRILLYTAALAATVGIVRSFLERTETPWSNAARGVREDAAPIFAVALRALAIYGVMAVAFSLLARTLSTHGHKAIAASQWFNTGAGLLLVLALAFIVAPAALQSLARGVAAPQLKQAASLFAAILGILSLLLGTFVGTNIRAMYNPSLAVRILLGLSGSWIVALPYVVLFVVLGLLVAKVRTSAPRTD